MKKTLILAILAFAIDAIAQHSPALQLKELKCNFYHRNNQNQLSLQCPADFLSGLNDQHQSYSSSRDLFGLEQRFDSVYEFEWNDLIYGWELDTRYIDILYNKDNYRTGVTAQIKNGIIWENSQQLISAYDENNNLISSLYRQWDGTEWTNFLQFLFTYDSNNQLTSEVLQIWMSTDWQNAYQFQYTYDDNHRLATEIYQSCDNNNCVNSSKNTYSYDVSNNLVQDVFQIWDEFNSLWGHSDQFLYTYDANYNQLTSLHQSWNGFSYDNEILLTSTYDGSDHLTSELLQIWETDLWVNGSHISYTFTGNDLSYWLAQNWNISHWENTYRHYYTYSSNHLLTKSIEERWNASSWLPGIHAFNSYGKGDFLSGASTRHFNTDGQFISYGDSTHYFYKTVTGIEDAVNANRGLCIYPNPTSGNFTISNTAEIGNVSIYNALGAQVFSQSDVTAETMEINLTGYPKGIYSIITSDGSNKLKQRVVIQ